jgi:hypothetical protein
MPLCVLWVELESVNGYYALDKQKQPIPQPLVNGARAVSTWNYQTSATNNNWQSVCWCPELFLAVTCASSGVGNRIMTSSNLISWTSRTSARDLSLQCVAYGGPVGSKNLVAVSSGGGLVQTSTRLYLATFDNPSTLTKDEELALPWARVWLLQIQKGAI